MKFLSRICAVTAMSLSTIPQRLGTSLVIVIGTAGVVAVLISILALASGLQQTMNATGRAERAVLLYRGAQSESGSSLPRDAVLSMLDLPGIQRAASGTPLATADALGSLWLPRISDPTPGSVILRGVTPEGMAARPEIELVQGDLFKPGLKQVMVGEAALAIYAGLGIGDKIVADTNEWEIVGVFSSGGSAHESELWTDAESVLSAFHRNSFNSITAWTGTDAGLDELKAAIAANPALTIDVHRESDYFADQSSQFSGFLTIMAKVIGVIMAVGAVFGAINSMYTAVSTRTGEIATLRAIGFGAGGIVVSVFVEALLLALVGALLGAAMAWLFFNGDNISTLSGNGLAQVVFSVDIGLGALLTGITWSVVLGLIGGLFPAIQAARLPVVAALRRA